MTGLMLGDCLEVLRTMPEASVDSCVTDPPYGLSFMGKGWDYDVPTAEVWREVFRVLKPGGHLLAFAGTRTQHRMAVNIEDAGFEIRDMIAWVYGSGFPKSLDVSKAIDKAAGAERETKPWLQRDRQSVFAGEAGDTTATSGNLQCPKCGKWKFAPDYCRCPRDSGPATPEAQQWSGWGTALKPSLEPVTVARKPLVGTVAENVLRFKTGAVNVDACRVSGERWPANLIHDGSDEVVRLFPQAGAAAPVKGTEASVASLGNVTGKRNRVPGAFHADTGTAARFFYTAKAAKSERQGVTHPTVKPLDLMAYLCRLVTPPGGTVLDPFMGTGTTIKAAISEGFQGIGIERDPQYFAMAEHRLNGAQLGLQLEVQP